ncbi:hypothetical protein [Stutzerimonas stutzeri]|uniref:hypothetical protein n=1 Tax=Stutzerimonas stutzeri TaxID=316 RepID=UPI001C2E532E|nr:hypothetical protein [Stutzerimonas stutzeri]
MFSERINKEELSGVATRFRDLLIKYSSAYPDAQRVLERASDLLEKAINRNINDPYRKGFLPEEFWESGTLFPLEDLSEKCAQFSLLLKGAISIKAIKSGVQIIEEQAEIDEKEFRQRGA